MRAGKLLPNLVPLLPGVAFLDEIAFLLEPIYFGLPWKGKVLELKDWHRGVVLGLDSSDIRAFIK